MICTSKFEENFESREKLLQNLVKICKENRNIFNYVIMISQNPSPWPHNLT